MNRTMWEMPIPSTALTRGPSFAALLKRQCELSFHVEGNNGDRRAGILFEDVEAYKCTYMTARSVNMINAAYDKLVSLDDSAWLSEVKANSASYYSQRQSTSGKFQHLMICFDDGPCYEFICGDFKPF